MTIHALLSPIERGYNYSKHFKEQWIHSNKLHPNLREKPYALILSDEDSIYHLSDDNTLVETFDPLRSDLLSEYL